MSAPTQHQNQEENDVRENEAVAIHPIGVLGVESHELVEKDVGHRGHAHRGARMAGVGRKRGIDLETHAPLAIEVLSTRIRGFNAARRCWENRAIAGQLLTTVAGQAAGDTTYGERADGVDGERVDLFVRHDGRYSKGRRLMRGG
jgi:hypothetical protein